MSETDRSPVALRRYSMLVDDWTVEKDTFTSPKPHAERPGQTVLFGDSFRNGSISAEITLLDSLAGRGGEPSMEAALVVRYGGPDAFYYAGTGAFYSKFFIGKAMTLSHAGPIFHALPRLGERSSLRKDKPYLLKVEFQASRIALYENDVQQIVAVDKEYQAGQCGLAAWRTQVRFANVRIQKAIPKAFLIMPFDSELDFVHKVIRETLGKYGIKCERADEIAVSRPVMEDVSKEIADADLVIVDFTGRNPNVYFEAGMADAWDKDWILLAQSSEDMTFDVRHIRSIRYRNAMGADIKLAEDLANALSALGYKSRKARQARSRA